MKRVVGQSNDPNKNQNGVCRPVANIEGSFGNQISAELNGAFGKIGFTIDAGSFRAGYGTNGGYLKSTQEFSASGSLGVEGFGVGGTVGVGRTGGVGLNVPSSQQLSNPNNSFQSIPDNFVGYEFKVAFIFGLDAKAGSDCSTPK